MTVTTISDELMQSWQRIRERFFTRGLPDYMIGSVERYVLNGIPPGHFLTSALSNNLSETFAHADEANMNAMYAWVMFFYNDLPVGCWGSPEKVERWIGRGGLHGINARKE